MKHIIVKRTIPRLIVLIPVNKDDTDPWNASVIMECFQPSSGTLTNANPFSCSLDFKWQYRI